MKPLPGCPAYYVGSSGSTVWDFEEDFGLSRRRSDAVEYIVRAGLKTSDPRGDLEKAISCLQREIEEIERGNR